MTSLTSSRKILQQKIADLLDGLTCGPPVADLAKIDAVLTEILDGLYKLDYNEIPEIFVPTPTGTKNGPKPARVRELKIRAVSYVAALRRRDNSLSLEDACAEVAEAFGLDGGTITAWRKTIRKQPSGMDAISPDQTRLSDLSSIDRGRIALSGSTSGQAGDVLKALQRDGLEFQKFGLSKPKKP